MVFELEPGEEVWPLRGLGTLEQELALQLVDGSLKSALSEGVEHRTVAWEGLVWREVEVDYFQHLTSLEQRE